MKYVDFDWDSLILSEIGSWPWGIRAGLLFLCFLIINVAGYHVFFKELRQNYLEQKTIQKQYQNKVALKQSLNTEQIKQEWAQIEENTQCLNQQLPDGPSEAALLEELSLYASEQGLEMQIFKPAAEEYKESWVERPFELSLLGHYHHLGAFLDRLSGMQRILTLHDCSIKINALDPKKLDIKLTAKIYWMNSKQSTPLSQHHSINENTVKNYSKQVESYHYNSGNLRNPFEPFISAQAKNPQPFLNVGPDKNRAREALESYPLDALQMMGTIAKQGQVFALVKDAQGMIHLVKEGNYLGQNFGCIDHVSENTLELKEWMLNGEGKYEERKTKLGLKNR